MNAEKCEVKALIPNDINAVEQQLFNTIGKSNDFIIKKIPVEDGPTILIACIEGLSDKGLMDRNIVGHIMAYHIDQQGNQKLFTQ